jgi:hypothetical protein
MGLPVFSATLTHPLRKPQLRVVSMNTLKTSLLARLSSYGLLAVLISITAAPSQLRAAVIAWGAAIVVDDPTDISKPAGSTLHAAIDFNTVVGAGTAGGDNIINGIPFTQVLLTSPGTVVTNFTDGPSFNATYHPTPTGDQDLDDLLDSHTYLPGNPTTALITLEGLTVGGQYQVQLIGVADSRTCCAGRIYEPDNGAGDFTTGVTMQRGMFQSTIGTFTASAATQPIQLRSLNAAAGNSDPGLTGIVVQRLIPEPTSLALVAFGAAALLGARRRRTR